MNIFFFAQNVAPVLRENKFIATIYNPALPSDQINQTKHTMHDQNIQHRSHTEVQDEILWMKYCGYHSSYDQLRAVSHQCIVSPKYQILV